MRPPRRKEVNQMSTRAIFLALILVPMFGPKAFAFAHQGDKLNHIADVYEAQAILIESFYVKFSTESIHHLPPKEVAKYTGWSIKQGREVLEFAYKGKKRYASTRLTNNDNDASTVLQKLDGSGTISTPANRIFAYDGRRYLTKHGGGENASVGIPPVSDDSGLYSDRYLGKVLKSPPDIINGRKRSLDSFIRSGAATLRPDMESIDGHPCDVIDYVNRAQPKEFGEIKVACWCDPDLGYAPRQLVVYFPDTTIPMWRTLNSDFVELADKTWFPKKSAADRFAELSAGLPEDQQAQPVGTWIYEVSEISVNNVPDELFTLEFRPGTIVSNFEAPEGAQHTFYMPGGGKTLDEAIRDVQSGRAARSGTWTIPLLGVLIGLGIAIWFVRSKRK